MLHNGHRSTRNYCNLAYRLLLECNYLELTLDFWLSSCPHERSKHGPGESVSSTKALKRRGMFSFLRASHTAVQQIEKEREGSGVSTRGRVMLGPRVSTIFLVLYSYSILTEQPRDAADPRS